MISAPLSKILDSSDGVLCEGIISYQTVHSLLFYPIKTNNAQFIQAGAATLIFGTFAKFTLYGCSLVSEGEPFYFRLNLVRQN